MFIPLSMPVYFRRKLSLSFLGLFVFFIQIKQTSITLVVAVAIASEHTVETAVGGGGRLR